MNPRKLLGLQIVTTFLLIDYKSIIIDLTQTQHHPINTDRISNIIDFNK